MHEVLGSVPSTGNKGKRGGGEGEGRERKKQRDNDRDFRPPLNTQVGLYSYNPSEFRASWLINT